MGHRPNKISEIIYQRHPAFKQNKPSSSEILHSNFTKTIQKIYFTLANKISEPPTRFGSWDISTKNFILEFDEERHFNRYRLATLKSDFYQRENINFSLASYKNYCQTHESHCLKTASWGKNWETSSANNQFGKSDPPRQFSTNGSARWKQRAFYDFLKDVSSEIIKIPIIRISIYDEHDGISINQLLKTNQDKAVINFIECKLEAAL